MGCREAIFADESTIDFPIFLLFFNTEFPIIQYFSYFLNPEFPIFLFVWATMPLDILNRGKNQNSKKYLDLKFTHKKTPYRTEFPSLENFQKAFNDITRKIKFLRPSLIALYSQNYKTAIRWQHYESFDCFEYLQNIPSQIRPPPKILAKISYPKKSRKRKFQAQKIPSIATVTWNPKYPLGTTDVLIP